MPFQSFKEHPGSAVAFHFAFFFLKIRTHSWWTCGFLTCCIFLYVNCHLRIFESRGIVIYVLDFNVKCQRPVQFLLGFFVKDVKHDLLRQGRMSLFWQSTMSLKLVIRKARLLTWKVFPYCSLSIARWAKTSPLCGSMVNTLTGSRSTPFPLIRNSWFVPAISLNIWIQRRNQVIDFCRFVGNFLCTPWFITREIDLGYGPGSSSCSSKVDKTHLLLWRTKGSCWDRGECQPEDCSQSHTFLPQRLRGSVKLPALNALHGPGEMLKSCREHSTIIKR